MKMPFHSFEMVLKKRYNPILIARTTTAGLKLELHKGNKVVFSQDEDNFGTVMTAVRDSLAEATKVWEEHQETLLTQLRDTNLELCGDGRCDSLGHSAEYLTYSFLCPDSRNIIHTEQVQVKEASGKSWLLLPEGLDVLSSKNGRNP
ncbi:hypothetical protein HPB52_012120 [Rhipicephalus sanguineus]|uniref:Uncharacterized protein n=1 Tax=Rhipicephalus sanguineus TaxID=34632 RepID=A0A9D4QAU0_RHISA|nr:hypothetical protein HPB52_012120 [Rhipicephalus sanguineus]